ncbi:MAG: hypothetical protein ACLR7U_15040, partial [Ruthenibacterium lactatiformans]
EMLIPFSTSVSPKCFAMFCSSRIVSPIFLSSLKPIGPGAGRKSGPQYSSPPPQSGTLERL